VKVSNSKFENKTRAGIYGVHGKKPIYALIKTRLKIGNSEQLKFFISNLREICYE
jgi:hypothetical protein